NPFRWFCYARLLAEQSDRFAYRSEDLQVTRASTKVAGESLTQFLIAGVGIPGQEALGREDHSRGAETALGAALQGETELQRIELSALRQALDRGDLRTLIGNRQHQAGHLGHAIDQNRTSTATGVIAAAFGSGQAEVLAQDVQQQPVGLGYEPVLFAVHRE